MEMTLTNSEKPAFFPGFGLMTLTISKKPAVSSYGAV